MSSLDDRGRAPRRPVAAPRGFGLAVVLSLAALLLGAILLIWIATDPAIIDWTHPL